MLFFKAIDKLLTTARAFQLFQLMRQGVLILIAIALAKSSLSVSAVGDYEMLTYLGYLLTFFWVSGFMQGLLSHYPQLEAGARKQLVFQAFLVFTAVGVFLGAALLLLQETLLPLLVQRTHLPYLGLFTIFLLTNLTASLQEHFYLLEKRKAAIVFYGLFSSGLQFLAVALPPLLGVSFFWSFAGLAALGVIKWLWLLIYVIRKGQWGWSNSIFSAWWFISWPLGAYALIAGLNQSLGPWFVGYFFGGDAAEFAIYRYGARELPLLSALAGALGSALIPAIAANLSAGLENLEVETRKLYHVLFPLSIVLLLTSNYWFPWIFDEKYIDSVPLFNIFLLLTPVHLLFARTILVAKQDTRWIPFFALGSFLTQLLIGFLLIPTMQLQGVALAAILAFAFEKWGLIIYTKIKHGIGLKTYTPIRWWLFYTALMLVVFAMV